MLLAVYVTPSIQLKESQDTCVSVDVDEAREHRTGGIPIFVKTVPTPMLLKRILGSLHPLTFPVKIPALRLMFWFAVLTPFPDQELPGSTPGSPNTSLVSPSIITINASSPLNTKP